MTPERRPGPVPDPGPVRVAERAVAEARSWVGTPYHDQASLRGVGADCLGLLRGVWRAVVGPEPMRMPAYTRDWAEASGRETLLEAARVAMVEIAPAEAGAGDVLVFRMRRGAVAKHCGILVGGGQLVHAYERTGVIAEPLSRGWRRRAVAAFRFPEPPVRRRGYN